MRPASDRKGLRQLADREPVLRVQPGQKRSPRRVGQRRESAIELRLLKLNHRVKLRGSGASRQVPFRRCQFELLCRENRSLPQLNQNAANRGCQPESAPHISPASTPAVSRRAPQWRNGICDFDHYHSLSHEMLGFAAGSVQLVLGGDNGREIDVRSGDVLVLSAGTGHRRIAQSDDFLVIGAYPPGQRGDIVRDKPAPARIQRIAKWDFPPRDPVIGEQGPTLRLWVNACL
jgi:uncharacterized protein YjlB